MFWTILLIVMVWCVGFIMGVQFDDRKAVKRSEQRAQRVQQVRRSRHLRRVV